MPDLISEQPEFYSRKRPLSLQTYEPIPTEWDETIASLAYLAAGQVPILSDAISAGEGWQAAKDAAQAIRDKSWKKAIASGGESALGWLGALPAIPAMGILAGRTAKTADLLKLAKAEQMTREGRALEDVYRETNWFKGKEGKWRFEIPDSELSVDFDRFTPDSNPLRRRLGWKSAETDIREVVKHPQLFEAYPELLDIAHEGHVFPEIFDNGKRIDSGIGGFDPAKGDSPPAIFAESSYSEYPDTLAHELQHAVQEIEGFSPGASYRPHFLNRWEDEDRFKFYMSRPGEIEARLVANRLKDASGDVFDDYFKAMALGSDYK